MNLGLASPGEDYNKSVLDLVNSIDKLLVDVASFERTFDVVIHKSDLLFDVFPEKKSEISCIVEEMYFITVNLIQNKIEHERRNNDKFFFNKESFNPEIVAKKTLEALLTKGDINTLVITVGLETVKLLIKYMAYLVNKAKIQQAEQSLYNQMSDVFYKVIISNFYDYGSHSLLVNTIRTNMSNIIHANNSNKGLKTILNIITTLNELNTNTSHRNNSFQIFKDELLEETLRINLSSRFNFEDNSFRLLHFLRQNKHKSYNNHKEKVLSESQQRLNQTAKEEIQNYKNGSAEGRKLILILMIFICGIVNLIVLFLIYITGNWDSFRANNEQGSIVGALILISIPILIITYIYGPVYFIKYKYYKESINFKKRLDNYLNLQEN